MTKALLVPVEGPIKEIELRGDDGGSNLDELQALVGGWIEAVPIPGFIEGGENASAYINEEGKLEGLAFNARATDFFVPGVGIFFGDYIAGPLVLVGFDPETGEDAPEIPEAVVARIRLIEAEAG